MKQKILIVEDDKRLANLIKDYLEQHGCKVLIESQGDKAIYRITAAQPDLVILDVMLPKVDGFTICQNVRPAYSGPILMLTAKEDDDSHIKGLSKGADDYVSKPVDPKVLLARIQALLRRHHKWQDNALRLEFGALVIDPQAQTVKLHDRVLDLTQREFDLLCFLANNAGTIMNRDSISQALRGIDYDGANRAIDMIVVSLRKKLGDIDNPPRYIKTVWGKGYLFIG